MQLHSVPDARWLATFPANAATPPIAAPPAMDAIAALPIGMLLAAPDKKPMPNP